MTRPLKKVNQLSMIFTHACTHTYTNRIKQLLKQILQTFQEADKFNFQKFF